MNAPSHHFQVAVQPDMSNKRRNSSSPECETPVKRQHQQAVNTILEHEGSQYDESDEFDTEERPQIHAFTGQTGAFPGLSKGRNELFYGPAADGLDYLRMVRSEAKGIPDLLVAQPVKDERPNGGVEEEEGGYWEEDAYIAAPQKQYADPEIGLPQAQLRYYEVLLAHHRLARAKIKCVPPLSAIEKLTSSQPISFPPNSKRARYAWEQCVRTRDPSPTQIACMDENSIFELLKLVTKKMRGLFEKDEVAVAKRLGAWIWAILGKCPERGEMASEEISILRELVRKAVEVRDWITRKIRSIESSSDNDDEDEDEDGDDEVEDGNDEVGEAQRLSGEKNEGEIVTQIQAARTRLASLPTKSEIGHGDAHSGGQDDAQEAKREKLVTLDMILTVVSEVYGQRDLQEYRTIWEQDPM